MNENRGFSNWSSSRAVKIIVISHCKSLVERAPDFLSVWQVGKYKAKVAIQKKQKYYLKSGFFIPSKNKPLSPPWTLFCFASLSLSLSLSSYPLSASLKISTRPGLQKSPTSEDIIFEQFLNQSN